MREVPGSIRVVTHVAISATYPLGSELPRIFVQEYHSVGIQAVRPHQPIWLSLFNLRKQINAAFFLTIYIIYTQSKKCGNEEQLRHTVDRNKTLMFPDIRVLGGHQLTLSFDMWCHIT